MLLRFKNLTFILKKTTMLAIALGIRQHLPVRLALISYRKIQTDSMPKVAFQVR